MRWHVVILTALGAALLVLTLIIALLPAPSSPELDLQEGEIQLARAQAALRSNDYPHAEQLAASIPIASPVFARSRLLAGEAATRGGHPETALKYYSEIASGTSPDALLSAYAMGEIFRASCQLDRARTSYEHVLESDPSNAFSHERMAFLLGITRQHWEAAPHYLELVKLGAWTLDSLAILSDIERSIEQPQMLMDCALKSPEDPLTRLALAADELYQGKPDRVKPHLEAILKQRPGLLSAQAMLGELLLSESEEAMKRWNTSLPASANEHPDIWFVRGLLCRKHQDLEAAAGCFAITVGLVPEHRRATYQLGQMLAQLQDPDADAFVQRAKQQAELGQLLDQVLASRGHDEAKLRRVTELSESLGRLWETWAWATTAFQLHPSAAWTEPIAKRIAAQLHSKLARTSSAFDLIAQSNLSSYVSKARTKVWDLPAKSAPVSAGEKLYAKSQIRFQRQTDAGIDFVYQNGADLNTPGSRMFEQTGGGVGVLDYDNDGWPDLYFTQGGRWDTGSKQPTPSEEYRDFLYRNRFGERFEEVAPSARVHSLNFGQGLAVGDYDADGFDDLFVGNIGRNQLWHNDGDGTFTECAEALDDQQSQWTTSAVMVDLNADGLLDIFEVNYLQGDNVFELICGGKGCSPKVFEGAPDQLRLNQGDGTFKVVPSACPAAESKGLGVLAFCLGNERQPVLLIANDQVANYLLVSQAGVDGQLQLKDEALLRGLALNSDGLPMASMGVAADDIDQNGLLDLLITNFRNEADTLYMQDAPGLFVDATPTAGMQSANFPFVGWGTQFLDAELDGDADAVVVNGDVDDSSADGVEFEMPPLLYVNDGTGRFRHAAGSEGGDFFARKYAGRALAKLDWNRDGLMDFVVSNIRSRAELVTNKSQGRGGYLNVFLHGTTSARNPIGARVVAKADNGVWTKQLLAGDGFQAHNERMIQLGLGDAKRIESLEVHWPSGKTSTLTDLPVNAVLNLVEEADTDQPPLWQNRMIEKAAGIP